MTKLSVLYDKDISERVFVLVSERVIPHKIDTVLTLSASSQSVYTDDDVIFSGTLTDEDSEPVAYANVILLKNNSTIATVTTNANGNFTTTVSNLTAGTNYFRASYYGDDTYDNSSSDTIQINVTDYSYALTISASTQTIYVGDDVTVSGTLTKNGNPYSGASVDIYDGAFNIGTVTTDSNGQYSKVVSDLIVGTHSLKAKYGTTESSTVSVVVNDLIETELSIDVPLVLTYGDDFNITGTLATSTRLGLQGETVKLKVGNTVVDTTTTEVDGGYVFNQTPVQTGNHTFQVIYDGDNVEHYNSCESTVVSRTVGKETTVLSVTSPVNNYTSYDGSITFTGTLTDDDGVVLPNKAILIKHNNTTLTTYTTGNNGAFNGTITGLSLGTYQLEIIYEGDSNYSATSVNRTVTVATHNYNLALVSSSPIIETGDSATVIATLTDNNVAVIGETLSYQIKHGSTTIDTGTDTTDNNGQISISYTGTGVGDVDVIVSYGSLLQETYEVEDCKYWNNGSRVNDLTIDSGVSCTTNGSYITITTSTSGEKRVTLPTSVASGENWIFSGEIAELGEVQSIGMKWDNYFVAQNDSLIPLKIDGGSQQNFNHNKTVGDVFAIKYENGTVSFLLNGNEMATSTTATFTYPLSFKFYTNQDRVQKIKNIKVKVL